MTRNIMFAAFAALAACSTSTPELIVGTWHIEDADSGGVVDNLAAVSVSRTDILNIHALLANGLLIDLAMAGRLTPHACRHNSLQLPAARGSTRDRRRVSHPDRKGGSDHRCV